MENRKWNRTDRLFFLSILGLIVSLVYFGVSLGQQMKAGAEIFQGVVSLGKIPYNEEFLEEAEKIPGIVSVSPVRRISIRLKAEGYTMETEVIGVNLSELSMTGTASGEISQGSTPVFLLGRKSLTGMTDYNGHKISKKMQKQLLENYEKTDWQYQLVGGEDKTESGSGEAESGGNSGSGESGSGENSSSDASQSGSRDAAGWLPCIVGAVLSDPEDEIYISSDQVCIFLGENSAFAENENISEILLTVRGKDNYRKATAWIMM